MVEEWWNFEQKGDSQRVSHFKHKSLYKYTRMARNLDSVEIKSMIELVRVKRDKLRYVQDVRAVREMGASLSDHHVVMCKVRLVGTWIKRREMVVGAGLGNRSKE